jgi:hypothetical protein
VQDGEALDVDAGRAAPWKSHLAAVLTRHYGCLIVRIAALEDGRKVHRWRVIGRPSDTTIVSYLYGWLTLDLARIASRESAGRGLAWKNSWLIGAVVGIRSQLQLAAAEERATVGAAALVRLDARAIDADEALRAAYPTAREKVARRRVVERSGFEALEECRAGERDALAVLGARPHAAIVDGDESRIGNADAVGGCTCRGT